MLLAVYRDEDVIRDVVVINLKRAGYDVVDVNCGEAALQRFEDEDGNFDIVLLDVMMPGMDGFTVCKRLREKSSTLGIIMLTARIRWFARPERFIRISMTLPRLLCRCMSTACSSPVIESGPFTLNLKSRTVSKNGVPIDLTQVEYQILEYFMNNKNTALDRASILNHIWGENYYGDYKIVDVNIRRIRLKIEDEPSNPQYIVTIWGYGYKWNDKG